MVLIMQKTEGLDHAGGSERKLFEFTSSITLENTLLASMCIKQYKCKNKCIKQYKCKNKKYRVVPATSGNGHKADGTWCVFLFLHSYFYIYIVLYTHTHHIRFTE